MLRNRWFSSATVVLVVWSVSFAAAKDSKKETSADSLHYLKPESVDVIKLLPAPPKMQSQEQEADLEAVLRMQDKRTEAEIARARAEQKLSVASFAPVMGEWFTAENLPVLAKLLKTAEADSKYFSGRAKKHFARPRPANDPRVKSVMGGDDEPSYPSGHSTRGIIFASILAEIAPEQRDALFERGQEIGWDRVIAGVHYPSDVIAGRVLGQALFQAMHANPEFVHDIEVARAEVTAPRSHQPVKAAGSSR